MYASKHSNRIKIIFILIAMILLCACQDVSVGNKVIYVGNRREDRYCEVISSVLPDYKIIQQGHPATQAFLERGTGLITIDVIAQSLLKADNRYYWYPHSKAGIVMAIDRDKTQDKIYSWKDMVQSDLLLGMSDQFAEAGCIISSIAYGLDNQNLAIEQAVEHLSERYDNKKLEFNNFDAPLLIMFDYQAVDLKKHGRNLEIVVPEDGTYVFERGILSKEEMHFPDNMSELVIGKGICTIDGECDENLYPSKANYKVAVSPSDMEKIQGELINARQYINRSICKTHRYATATAWEYVISALAAIAIFVLWTGSVQMRSAQKDISIALLGIGICMVMWVGARFIKWQVATDTLINRYLWYSYYIFILTLSNFFLWLSTAVNEPEGKTLMPKWMRILLIFEALMILMVFTNEIHQWVFIFDKTADFWKKEYRYGWGYVLIYVSFAVPLFLGIIILSTKFWKSPKRIRVLIPISISLAMMTFGILYVMRFPPAWNGDLALTMCIFVLMFGESAMRTNLIPLNTKYVSLFHNSSLNMSILDSSGADIYSSISAKEIPKDLKERIIESRKPTILSLDKNTLLYADPITAGNVVWEEDISDLEELRENISKSIEQVKKANELLEAQTQIKAEKESGRAKLELLNELNEEIGDKMNRLEILVEQLRELETLGDKKGYEQVLAEINLTSIYIKRRCNLMFYVEQETISSDATVTHISELLECAENLGIHSAPVLNLVGEVETKMGILLYDLCFSVLKFLLQEKNQELMLHCYQKDNDFVILFLCDVNCSGYRPSEKLSAALNQMKAKILFRELDEVSSIQITIPSKRKEEGYV